MLTIYEQIQQSIDFIEARLGDGLTARESARVAGMSLRGFHRYFPALTGYRFGEYVRKRRLSTAADRLMASDVNVIEIALQSGYDSHQAFTRAFKKEFGSPPLRFRNGPGQVPRTRKLDLVGEVNMGVLTKTLPDMTVVCFDGFKPNPEDEAGRRMQAWLEANPDATGSHRIFGYNIDPEGRLAHNPDNDGYRCNVTIPEPSLPLDGEVATAVVAAGTFVVTSIEGSFEEDPSGSWITAGWMRLQEMVKLNGLTVHPSHRWFEEWLEPTTPGLTRMDLYLEII